MSAPLTVSVLICVRDGQAYLAEAIESALAQTAPPAEVIVVDDGSTDDSAAIARAFGPPVRVVQQEPLGLGAARNTAVSQASGQIVAFLDSDDLWEPTKLELQLQAFEQDPELAIVFVHTQEFADAADEGRFAVRQAPLAGIISSAFCVRREALEQVGEFPADSQLGEILGWLLRARELGLRELTLPEVLMRRRVHAGNMTRGHREFGDYARLLKASLDRRRMSA